MKKRPVSKTRETRYPSYAEARQERPVWLRRLTIGAAVLGASTWLACDDFRRYINRDDHQHIPLPGVMPELITPGLPGDDDDSAGPEDPTPAADEAPTPEEEVRPEGRTRGRVAMPHKGEEA